MMRLRLVSGNVEKLYEDIAELERRNPALQQNIFEREFNEQKKIAKQKIATEVGQLEELLHDVSSECVDVKREYSAVSSDVARFRETKSKIEDKIKKLFDDRAVLAQAITKNQNPELQEPLKTLYGEVEVGLVVLTKARDDVEDKINVLEKQRGELGNKYRELKERVKSLRNELDRLRNKSKELSRIGEPQDSRGQSWAAERAEYVAEHGYVAAQYQPRGWVAKILAESSSRGGDDMHTAQGNDSRNNGRNDVSR